MEGKPIDENMIAFIRTGTTTKTDVVWELGAPDNSGTESDERGALREDWVSYTSWRHRGVVGLIFLMLPPAYPTSVAVEHSCRRPSVLKIWFDEGGVVKRHEFGQGETRCETREESHN
jgi:hypothetical protein